MMISNGNEKQQLPVFIKHSFQPPSKIHEVLRLFPSFQKYIPNLDPSTKQEKQFGFAEFGTLEGVSLCNNILPSFGVIVRVDKSVRVLSRKDEQLAQKISALLGTEHTLKGFVPEQQHRQQSRTDGNELKSMAEEIVLKKKMDLQRTYADRLERYRAFEARLMHSIQSDDSHAKLEERIHRLQNEYENYGEDDGLWVEDREKWIRERQRQSEAERYADNKDRNRELREMKMHRSDVSLPETVASSVSVSVHSVAGSQQSAATTKAVTWTVFRKELEAHIKQNAPFLIPYTGKAAEMSLDDLLNYPVKWQQLTKEVIDGPIKSVITQTIEKLLGSAEEDLVEFVMEIVFTSETCDPQKVKSDILETFEKAEDSEELLVRIWHECIFQSEKIYLLDGRTYLSGTDGPKLSEIEIQQIL